MKRVKVFVEFGVGENAPNVARRLRRRGFEAHVKDHFWVVIIQDGWKYETALQEIRTVMRAVAPRAIAIDWGEVAEE